MFSKKNESTKKQDALLMSDGHGMLVIPKDAVIIDANPGIKYTLPIPNPLAPKTLYLYDKPPNGTGYTINTDQTAELGINNRVVFTKNLTTTKEESLIGSDLSQIIKEYKNKNENIKVLAKPLKAYPGVLQVNLCKAVKVDNTNNRRDVGDKIEILKTGFMYESDLKPQEKFKAVNQNIFTHLPSVSDIEQANMGNCFLLASLLALLTKRIGDDKGMSGPELIMSMMKQSDDGRTTVVKLFHPLTLEPMYVSVDTSEHYLKFKSAVRHEALWVHILEKAYAGLGFEAYEEEKKSQYQAIYYGKNENKNEAEEIPKYGVTPASFLAAYGTGGSPDLALTILTGKKAESYPLVDVNATHAMKNPLNPASITLITTAGLTLNLMNILRTNPNASAEELNNAFKITTDKDSTWLDESWQESSLYKALLDKNGVLDQSLLIAWTAYVAKAILSKGQNDLFEKLLKICKVDAKSEPGLSIDGKADFIKTLDQLSKLIPPPPEAVLKRFYQYISSHQIEGDRKIYALPGIIGTGEYSKKEYDLFDELTKKIKKEERILTTTTESTFPDKGEGLVKHHVYAITDVHRKTVKGKDLLFVTLRNPWADTGREYDFSTTPPKVSNNKSLAEFDLEITDFMKYCSGYSVGSTPLAQKDLTNTPSTFKK